MATVIMTQSSGAFVALLAAMVPAAVIIVFTWWHKRRRRQKTQPPQAEKLLRPAGYSLSIMLDGLADRAISKLLFAFGLCAIAGVFLDAATKTTGLGLASFVLFASAFGVGGAYVTVWVVRDLIRGQNLRLGLRGEQAVGEALQEVGHCGFRAFHDFPSGDNWNIDHIAVGPPGVFLIETKARNRVRPRPGQQQPAHVVQIFGETLQFPSGRDLKAVPQAERNAKWLAGYLTKKTGEKVEVEALVVLPGWFFEIKQPPSPGTMVVNTTYLIKYLSGRAARLPEAQVRRITAALDEKCRDVEF
jgi:hypothetical protein